MFSYAVCVPVSVVSGSLTAVVVAGRLPTSNPTRESHRTPASLHGSLSRGISYSFFVPPFVLCMAPVQEGTSVVPVHDKQAADGL